MENEQWERKPVFISHRVIATIDIYEPHEHDCFSLWKSMFETDDIPEEQYSAKCVNFKKAAKELINHLHERWCVEFLNELMISSAEHIMEHWKEFSPDERLSEYKKSLIEDIKKVIKDY